MVTVMLDTTRTSPFSVFKSQVLLDVSTLTTSLATWKEPVYLDNSSSIPICLILQLPYKFVPTTISNRSCKTMVLHHVLDSKSFYVNDLVLVNQLACGLMQVITPYVSDLLVYSCQLMTKFHYLVGLFVRCLVLPPVKFPLHSLYLPLERAIRLNIGILLPITINNQRFDAKVYTNFLFYFFEWLDFLFNHQRAVILSCLVLSNSTIRYFLWHFTMNDTLDSFLELRYRQLAINQFDVLWYTESLLVMFDLEL